MNSWMLTDRDKDLLRKLYSHGLLTTEQIERVFFPRTSRTTVLRRLRQLEEGGMIRKRGCLGDAMAVWVIEPKGMKAVGEAVVKAYYPLHQLDHEITINEIRMRLEESHQVSKWVTERRMRQLAVRDQWNEDDVILIPDGFVFLRKFLAKERGVRLEVELHLKSRQRYEKRFKEFNLNIPDHRRFNWYFVPSESISDRILAYAKKFVGSDFENKIGYTLIPEFLADLNTARLKTKEWTKPLSDVFAEPVEGAQGGAQPQSGERNLKLEITAA